MLFGSVAGLSAFSLDPPSEAALSALLAADERSFLAQPEPLKTIAGVESALRIDPPQLAHADGPGEWTEWITSTDISQSRQT